MKGSRGIHPTVQDQRNRLMTTHDIGKFERIEMYLKAVYTLQYSFPPVTVTKVAESVGVSPPSASEMLKRLEQQGLITTGEEGIRLTPAGRQTAVQVVRRLRLAEHLLAGLLHLELGKVYDEACKMEHVISGEVETHLREVLGNPKTCPHGHPIPYDDEDLPTRSQPSIGDLRPGQRARVTSIPEEDAQMVQYLVRLGLTPGAEILVEEIAPYGGPVFLQVGGTRQAIGPEVAMKVKVEGVTSA
ncbi:MAG: metal-dependent transcriptional regulator [Armatimonadota bacterium]|nr:metal-dependent transcriptional regulator [Armatimonadota bacterium]